MKLDTCEWSRFEANKTVAGILKLIELAMIISYIRNNGLTKKIPTVICAIADTAMHFTKCTV